MQKLVDKSRARISFHKSPPEASVRCGKEPKRYKQVF